MRSGVAGSRSVTRFGHVAGVSGRFVAGERFPIFLFFLLWAIGLALLWNREEPHKFNTVVVFLVVSILGYLIIRKATRAGIVKSQRQWMMVLMLKLSLILLLTFVWIEGWGPGQHRFEWGRDPLAYDLYGTWVAEDGYLESLPFFSRGELFGVVFYIGSIYRLFGVSTLYVNLFNSLLSLVAFLSVVGILTDLTKEARPWQLLRYGLFLPEIAYHDSSPTKEPLSMALFFFALFLGIRLLNGRVRPRDYIYLLVSTLGLWTVRPPLVLAFVALMMCFAVYRKKARGLVLLGCGSLALILLLNVSGGLFSRESFGLQQQMDRILDWELKRRHTASAITSGSTSDDPLKQMVNKYLLVEGPLDILYVGPLRMMVLLAAPFPAIIIFPEQLSLERGTALVWNSNLNKLSSLILLFLAPLILSAIFQKRCRASPVYPYIVLGFLLLLFLAANSRALMQIRARTMVDPLLLATALVGYRYGQPRMFAFPCLAIVVLVLGFYYLVWTS